MPILNRDLDVSQQKDVFHFRGATQISAACTYMIGIVPYQGVVQSVRHAALGLSGAMQVAMQIRRFAGGLTTIGLGISNMVMSALGTSGVVGYSGLAVPGSTLLLVQAGDVLAFETSGANTAATELLLEVVIKKTQDIVSHNGVSS